ncbi:uncharacterized protein LOC112464432 isoform X1 [Temnothorax curvispinosus]|uniref:Uncharacterized protein LOC112464432 isoform X1 n=1 Tax=Temnothorax curvispinosus TaxID=300111 RepID=A0A6J1QZ77_9HYME|nr:uncharacterized protein LOC112464432 isoform X1 [Temnothorax curvispinosus]
MSKQTRVLELNKCILSRLWYTSLNIFHVNNDSTFLKEFHHTCCVDLSELETVIESLIHSPDEEQYQWIAYVLLWKLIDSKSSNVGCDIQCNIQTQFDCIQMKNAIEMCDNVPDCLHKELSVFLQQLNVECSVKHTSNIILEQIFTFLKDNTYVNVETVCWIINKLISVAPNAHNVVSNLQDIYFSTFKSCLEHIPARRNCCLNHTIAIDSSSEADSPTHGSNPLRVVLRLLSKIDTDVDIDAQVEFLKIVYPTLSKSHHVKDIELALYSRKNEKMLSEWLSLWNKTHACLESATTLPTAYNISEGIFKLAENSEISLGKQDVLERTCTRKLHWLNDILDICYILTTKRKYNQVELLLSCDLLRRLYPVLLFKVLNDCPREMIDTSESYDNDIFICESISFLLEKCYPDLRNDYDLNNLYTLLKSHIRIVVYIFQWKKRHFVNAKLDSRELKNVQSDATAIERTVSVKQILSLLQKHNILFVLKLTTNIHDQDHSDIQDLLKDTSPNQSANFQAYCCIISALKAIFLCEFYNTEYKQVTKYFTDMISYLSSLFPLSSRMEAMESIFSLLFLRYEDFNVTNASSKDDDCTIRKSVEYDKSGFIANKYAVRDMLYYLWRNTLITTEEIDELQVLGLHEEIQRLRENMLTFKSTLKDTRWRLKFHMGSDFIENVGRPQDESDGSSTTNKSDALVSQKPNFPHRVKGDSFFYKGDSASDETKVKSDSSSDAGLLCGNKRRKRSKISTTTADYLSTRDKLSLINLMLASKESLILHCLWKGTFQKAQEVVEMFHMENTQLDGEIRFAEALHKFKHNICKHICTSDAIDSSKESSRTCTLENIKFAAQEGVQSSRYINQLETFLASQQVHLRMLDTNILRSDEILTLSVLDLSLTIGETYQISNNLCDIAMKYLKLCETFDSTGHASFFSRIHQLFYENKNNTPMTTILCDARRPLYIKDWKENDAVWCEFENNYRTLYDLERAEITEARSCDNNYILGLKTIEKMSDIFNSEKYLYNVYSYLQLVSTIIPDDTTVRTVFDLLKTPLHHYFGYQIFDLNTEPDKLEKIAFGLQVNLIYSILVNACPSISCYNERNCSSIKDSECIILNQYQVPNQSGAKNVTVKGPNQCVSEILAELLQVLRNVSSGQSHLDNSHLRSISDHTDIRMILNKTASLASLDLGELSVGDETLTFFLNVWNIMFLHANLDVWSKDPPLQSLRHTVSLTSIGYMIGDLGLVTLAALRSKLLGSLANDKNLKFFTRVEELNELAWQDLDLVQNPKIIFAMANEFYGTPEIRVYEAQTLNDELNDVAHDYIAYYSSVSPDDISIDRPRRKINLPDLVRRYQNTFARNTDIDVTNVSRSLLPADDFEKLNGDVDVEYAMSNYTYEVILKYSGHSTSSVTTTNVIVQTSFWQTRKLRPSLLQYLERHCWLLSYLIQRMHNENPTILENNYDNIKRTACLENLLTSSWVDKLKLLFNNNQTLAAIHDSVPVHDVWHYFELRKDHNWQNSLEILNALADSVIKYNTELQRFKDLILSHMLSNLGVLSITRMLQYLYQIKDIHILAQMILHNINKWPMILCEHALSHALQHEHSHKLPVHCRHRMNGISCRITIFHKMIPYCMSRSNSTWYDIVYCTEKVDPFEIIKSLIDADQFELCLEWLECQAFSLEMQTPVIQDFLIGLLKNEQQDFKQALKFLQALPLTQSVKICKGVLKKLESISALQFIANYLLDHCRIVEQPKYRKTLVGLEILKMLENKDRALYIHLIREPLLMLEQLLMNSKFENIQKILNMLHEVLQHPDIGISNFDKVIRFYAKKSLDFRVSLHQRDGTENKARNISQSNLETEDNEFIMPVNVPTKEEWVPNDRARECDCCKAVIFSMFNRRHHCRRCGRVVCAMCSQHRMQVAGYPSTVLVRVCDDCKHQTVLQMRAVQSVPSTSSSELFDYWRLTRDERHNRTIREEFSFEYAPNISLCLAILNLHFDPKIYTSFLLDRCDEMKRLLQPVNGGRINPEIDHAVIIKMIRSLLVAAKMKCAKFGFNTGLAHCDRFLSQVDLIATLVKSDCVALIPTDDDLDEHTLRKLRDLLTEKERWTLALDVSTKAGLDTQGVWAAWGKSCLKVGYLEQAKEKFHHCLDKIVHEDLDDWVVLSYSKESIENPETELTERTTASGPKRDEILDEGKKACSKGGHLKRSEYSKCRPLKDPPLLTEILQILDNLSTYRSRTQHSSPQPKSDAAQEILQTLNSLKAVSQNQFNVKYLIPANQTVYYQESLYYLLAYGSYTSILQFFLKHKEFDKCLAYILDNDMERDLFLNGVYLYCLRNGHVEKLHDAMKAKDPTLVIWRKYLIAVCHFMERKQYWHILYQIQLFMRDCVRASMTCIRFYTTEANTYSDLHNRAHLLQDAQKHLESDVQMESLTKRRKNISSVHSGQSTLAMEMEPSEIDRHINTICRQTEIVKFLANCEKEERVSTEFLNLFPDIDSDNPPATLELPTLFGNQQQKIHLSVLAILCGRDIGEGFGIAFRIIQDYNLPQQKVYSLAGHVLALKSNVAAIEQLIKCCRSSGAHNAHVISDHVLAHCVKLLLTHSYTEQNPTLKNHIDTLIRLIIDTELRINAYIESKQLKAAYLLAVKHSRAQDIRRILKESDRLGQSAIKAICLKWLQQEPKG